MIGAHLILVYLVIRVWVSIFLPSEDRSHGGGHGGGSDQQQEVRRRNAANVAMYGQGSVEVRTVTVVVSKSC